MTSFTRLLVALTLAALPVAAVADQVQMQTQTIRAGTAIRPVAPLAPSRAVTQAVPKGPSHTAFGTITVLAKTTFVMRLRTGKLLDVDAASAIASGRFSTPLFVGKVVAVTGPVDGRGTLYALTVTRFTQIDATTPRDR